MNPRPYDFEEARTAARKASEAQAATEKAMQEAYRDRALKERAYREALAARLIKARVTEEIAWTAAGDVARGDRDVAQRRFDRDVAEGVVKALEQAAWRHAADRKDLQRLIGWSERVAPDGQYEPAVGAA